MKVIRMSCEYDLNKVKASGVCESTEHPNVEVQKYYINKTRNTASTKREMLHQ